MRLITNLPAFQQIRNAVEHGIPLFMDLRQERMGDKSAAVAVAKWIAHEANARVTIVEAQQKTDFRLGDYLRDETVPVIELPLEAELDGLDVHTLQTGIESLWFLNAYVSTLGIRAGLSLEREFKCSDEILFCLLTDTEYNERRDMNVHSVKAAADRLTEAGYSVKVLTMNPTPVIPEAVQMSMREAVHQIATAKCVIAGDSGFSHVAGGFGVPLVAIYPDWMHVGKSRLEHAIRVMEWWGIPATHLNYTFFPNAEKLRVVELGTDHNFSPAHILESVQVLAPQSLLSLG
jgi:hypothetical protein